MTKHCFVVRGPRTWGRASRDRDRLLGHQRLPFPNKRMVFSSEARGAPPQSGFSTSKS